MNRLVFWVLAGLVVISAQVGIILVAFDFGAESGCPGVAEIEDLKEGFRRQQVSIANNELHERIAKQKSKIRIHEVTIAELKKTQKKMGVKIDDLTEELKFYQQVVAPEDPSGSNVAPFDLKITPDKSEDNSYRFDITLAQNKKKKNVISGYVQVIIKGKESEKITVGDDKKGLPFSLKYFQRISQIFKLPETMVPEKVIVKVKLKWSNGSIFSKSYKWQELLHK